MEIRRKVATSLELVGRIFLIVLLVVGLADAVEGLRYLSREHGFRSELLSRPSQQSKAIHTPRELPVDDGGDAFIYHGGGINAQDAVAATVLGETGNRATVWANGGKQSLATPPGVRYCLALGINGGGDVVGYAVTEKHAAVTWATGRYSTCTLLPSLPGLSCSEAWAINQKGQIAGRCYQPSTGRVPWWAERSRAALWEGGAVRDLGMPRNCKASRACALNAAGEAVGWALTRNDRTHACLWELGKAIDLGVLPGGHVSTAVGINDVGDIVGDADTANGELHTILWSHGVMRDLGTPLHTGTFKPIAINNRGEIVGEERDNWRIYVWDPRHGMRIVQLPDDPALTLQRALGINDSGDIAVLGIDITRRHEVYNHRLFLLSPRSS